MARPPEDLGTTRAGDAASLPEHRSGPLGAQSVVRVTCVRSGRRADDRTGELGLGRLIDQLTVGRPCRIEFEREAPALVTSPVRGIERIGPGVVQVVTGNSVYRLEIGLSVEAPDRTASRRTPSMPSRSARLAQLHQQARRLMETREGSSGNTCFVSLSELSQRVRGPFGPGTPVRIARRKLADPTADFEEVGLGRMLDRLEPNEPARVAVNGGPTFLTSPIRRLRLVDARCVEFETSNTVYRLERT